MKYTIKKYLKNITILSLMISFGFAIKNKYANMENNNEIIDDLKNKDKAMANVNKQNTENKEENIKRNKGNKNLMIMFLIIGITFTFSGIIFYLIWNINTTSDNHKDILQLNKKENHIKLMLDNIEIDDGVEKKIIDQQLNNQLLENNIPKLNKEETIIKSMIDNIKVDDEGEEKIINQEEIEELYFKLEFSEILIKYLSKKIKDNNNLNSYRYHKVELQNYSKMYLSFNTDNCDFFINLFDSDSGSAGIPLLVNNDNLIKLSFQKEISHSKDNKFRIFNIKSFKLKLENILSEDIKKTLEIQKNPDIKFFNIYTECYEKKKNILLFNPIVENSNLFNNQICIKFSIDNNEESD